MSVPALHIVMPIHNGERALPASLAALGAQLNHGMRLSLVLNGCSDRSRAVVQARLEALNASGAEVRLIEIEQGSRNAALNAGDRDDDGLHRIYVDQDAVLCPEALEFVAEAFKRQACFVTGRAAWRSPSPLVTLALNAWSELPYVRGSPVSAGFYAVSDQGRRRWADWPMSLPDDKFARLQFRSEERVRIDAMTYEVDAPADWRAFVAARRRYHISNRRLAREAPEALDRDIAKSAGLASIIARPDLWLGCALLTVAEGAAIMGGSA